MAVHDPYSHCFCPAFITIHIIATTPPEAALVFFWVYSLRVRYIQEHYAPIAAREYYGYDSSLQVQNASSGPTTARITYYALGQITPTLTAVK